MNLLDQLKENSVLLSDFLLFPNNPRKYLQKANNDEPITFVYRNLLYIASALITIFLLLVLKNQKYHFDIIPIFALTIINYILSLLSAAPYYMVCRHLGKVKPFVFAMNYTVAIKAVISILAESFFVLYVYSENRIFYFIKAFIMIISILFVPALFSFYIIEIKSVIKKIFNFLFLLVGIVLVVILMTSVLLAFPEESIKTISPFYDVAGGETYDELSAINNELIPLLKIIEPNEFLPDSFEITQKISEYENLIIKFTNVSTKLQNRENHVVFKKTKYFINEYNDTVGLLINFYRDCLIATKQIEQVYKDILPKYPNNNIVLVDRAKLENDVKRMIMPAANRYANALKTLYDSDFLAPIREYTDFQNALVDLMEKVPFYLI